MDAGGICLAHPKGHSIINPSFSHSACAQAEAVGQAVVGMEFSGDAQSRELLQAVLHGVPRGDAVGSAAASVSGRIVRRNCSVTCVLHDNRTGLWNIVASCK